MGLAVAGLACGGCAWEVTPPVVPPGAETATVFVTDYGRHARLGLPVGDRTVVEWGFGDWEYYAMEKTGPASSVRAISPFGRSALARREFHGVGGDAGEFSGSAGGVRTAAIKVERAKSDALFLDLESRWRRGREVEAVRRDTDGLEFAAGEERYHLLHNSNKKTAVWLRELGCEVRGVPVISNFRVSER